MLIAKIEFLAACPNSKVAVIDVTQLHKRLTQIETILVGNGIGNVVISQNSRILHLRKKPEPGHLNVHVELEAA